MSSLAGRNILVTGSTQGVGQAIVIAAAGPAAQTPDLALSTFCPACGTEETGAMFCGGCGRKAN